MILSGVVVYRREKVEKTYAQLPEADQTLYRSFFPVCEPESGAAPAQLAPEPEAVAEGLSAKQHQEIWDLNGLHFCGPADLQCNQLLHGLLCPALLSVLVGWGFAQKFGGQLGRSVLAAGVLFFAILGPVCARVVFFGSQGLFPNASRLNHSCLPNAEWQIEPSTGTSARLSLRAKEKVKKGQELLVDYIPELEHLDPQERRKLLQQDYGFLCHCLKCTGAAPRAAEEEAEE
ncbi:unnamed protein product [Effrenium voratum]|nr:unnamed protein product [Effrenium voratum]